MNDDARASDTHAPVTKRVRKRKWDRLMERKEQTLANRILRTQQGPKYEEQVRELVKRGEAISTEHLGKLGRALLERDLVNPPKDHRARIQVARAGLECSGVIGPRSAELHLHQHIETLPPVVQSMLLSKMTELAGLQSSPELAATVIDLPLPPEPIDGEDKNHG